METRDEGIKNFVTYVSTLLVVHVVVIVVAVVML